MHATLTRNGYQQKVISLPPCRQRSLAGLLLAVAVLTVGCQNAPGHSTGAANAASIAQVIDLPPGASPSAMTVSSDGNLWVTEESISAIARIDKAGHIRQYRIPGSSNDPDGILQGPDGRIWFVGFEVIGQVNTSGPMTGWEDGTGTSSPIFPAALTGPRRRRLVHERIRHHSQHRTCQRLARSNGRGGAAKQQLHLPCRRHRSGPGQCRVVL